MSSGPVPSPTPETAPFWESTRARAMRLPFCTACGRAHFHPRSYCPFCTSAQLEWREVSGRATLASYVINRRPAPVFDLGAQIIALVDLAEGPRMMSNLVGVDPDPGALRLGMPLQVRYTERGDQVLPLFTPARAAA